MAGGEDLLAGPGQLLAQELGQRLVIDQDAQGAIPSLLVGEFGITKPSPSRSPIRGGE